MEADFAPQGTGGSVWGCLWLSQPGELLASRGQRPGMLLTTLHAQNTHPTHRAHG